MNKLYVNVFVCLGLEIMVWSDDCFYLDIFIIYCYSFVIFEVKLVLNLFCYCLKIILKL